MSDELDALSDAALSEVFAVEVAGYIKDENTAGLWHDNTGMMVWLYERTIFSTSADAVLPFIGKKGSTWRALSVAENTCVTYWPDTVGMCYTADAKTFARAACIALIRAKRSTK